MKAIVLIAGLALFIAAQAKIVERFDEASRIITHPAEATDAWQDIRSGWG